MANKTIVLKGDPLRKELDAGGTITPGHLCKRASDGDVEVHGTAGGPAAPMFAIEDALQGNDIDDNYTSGNRVQLVVARPGDEIYAWLKQGESVVPGDFLESAGDGTLQKYAASSAGVVENPRSIVAQALETLDLSTSGVTATRLEVEVI